MKKELGATGGVAIVSADADKRGADDWQKVLRTKVHSNVTFCGTAICFNDSELFSV